MNLFSNHKELLVRSESTMSQKKLKSDCVVAFEVGKKRDAEKLLPQIEQPADIRTYYVRGMSWYAGLVSLLHLAAHNGWMDIIIGLITKYKCDTNCKDSRGRIPLYYAANNNHLEVVRYFINEQHCDPMTRDNDGDTPLHYACHYEHLNIAEAHCHYEHLNIAQYLISEAHCNSSCENKKGDTPLHCTNWGSGGIVCSTWQLTVAGWISSLS